MSNRLAAAAEYRQKRNKIIWGRAGFLVRRLHQIYVAIFLEECASAHITPVQWGVMMLIAGAPKLGYIEIGEQLGIDRSNVANVVNRLVLRKLIREEINKTDRRKRSVSITTAGRTLIKRFEPHVLASHNKLLAPLSKSDKALFMDLLRQIVAQNNFLSRAPLRIPGIPDA